MLLYPCRCSARNGRTILTRKCVYMNTSISVSRVVLYAISLSYVVFTFQRVQWVQKPLGKLYTFAFCPDNSVSRVGGCPAADHVAPPRTTSHLSWLLASFDMTSFHIAWIARGCRLRGIQSSSHTKTYGSPRDFASSTTLICDNEHPFQPGVSCTAGVRTSGKAPFQSVWICSHRSGRLSKLMTYATAIY